jgi:hypothetical protein
MFDKINEQLNEIDNPHNENDRYIYENAIDPDQDDEITEE